MFIPGASKAKFNLIDLSIKKDSIQLTKIDHITNEWDTGKDRNNEFDNIKKSYELDGTNE